MSEPMSPSSPPPQPRLAAGSAAAPSPASGPGAADPAAVAELERDYAEHLFRTLGRFPEVATPNDRYLALAHAVRDHLLARWVRTGEAYYRARARTVIY